MTSEENTSSVFHTSSQLVADGGKTREPMGQCQTEMQLRDVAPGLTDQYTNFIHALQEPIDNSVSAIVKNEDYFDEPTDKEDDVVEICLSVIKEKGLVWFIVADNGPGIPYDTLERDVFLLGDQSSSDGILNNVGWGLKQAIAWFENQVNTNININDSARDSNFRIVTRSEEDGLLSVGGPIDGSLQIYREDESLWTEGLQGDPLENKATGTRVYLPCTFDQVDENLWKQGPAHLETRLHALQERLGLQYRDLLNARDNNRITIRYENKDDGTTRVYEVTPLDLVYDTEVDPDYPLVDDFEITANGITYNITYERGILDYNKIWGAAEEADSGLVTSGDNKLRWYQPSEETAGVDIYANGRILMFSELDIFDRTYNQSLNYFGGTVRIIPQNSSEEVPTENKKVAIDRGSELWRKLAKELRELGVEAKRYDDDGEESSGQSEEDSDDEENGGAGESEEGEGDGGDEKEDNGGEEGEDGGEEEHTAGGSDEDEEEEAEDVDRHREGQKEDGEQEPDAENDGSDSEGNKKDEESVDDEEESEDKGGDSLDGVIEQLKDANPDHSFDQNQVFDGAEIDLVESREDGSVILWVVKSETATPADAYTLAMVQNHYKRSDNNLSEVCLVAPDASSAFERDLSELQDYNDLQEDPYVITYKPEDEI